MGRMDVRDISVSDSLEKYFLKIRVRIIVYLI
jgi:hypothetical protein